MKKPEIEVVRFGAEDVIATSKVVTWKNIGGGNKDSTVSFGVNTYGRQEEGKNVAADALSALLNYCGQSNFDVKYAMTKTTFTTFDGIPGPSFDTLFKDEGSESTSYNGDYTYRGSYTYDGDGNVYYWFIKP